jgi:hypothetical protein
MKKLLRLGMGLALVLTCVSGTGHAGEVYNAMVLQQHPAAMASTAQPCVPCNPMTPMGFGGYYSCHGDAWVRTRNGCYVTAMSQVPPINANSCKGAPSLSACWRNIALAINSLWW